jgi:rhodanese-related sulfurtransferase
MAVDATAVARNLFVGSAPLPGLGGFDVIVLCSSGYQPPAAHYPGVIVEHFPFDDAPRLSSRELRVPVQAARRVGHHLGRGRRVLVTCQMGRNRSAFVAALALHLWTGRSGKECADQVRRHRIDPLGVRALANRDFRRALEKLPGRAPEAGAMLGR